MKIRSIVACIAAIAVAGPGLAGTENPRVVIKTEKGDIAVEVDLARAPVTAANFLRYVEAGLYDGSTFHRTVTPDNQPDNAVRIEVIQGGELPRKRNSRPSPTRRPR